LVVNREQWHARPLRSSDRPQPVDSWSRDVTVVLWAIALMLLIAGLALWLNPAPIVPPVAL
jgi:hypothetical protein